MRRTNDGGSTWGGWRMLYDVNSVLGTVSQSGGVPTGALLETGSNANGEYMRFASGQQLCVRRNWSPAAIGDTWTYPASFIAQATTSVLVTPTCRHPGGGRRGRRGGIDR